MAATGLRFTELIEWRAQVLDAF
ncbi:hypothetical protein PLUA15_310061 [Pseudomonas lundensis]|uniref:Phage tail protein n=1 Tax=Pseudomonas lundensis TaxID=86185 RepID=A0AAX2H8Z7_9PSED|nr:hypothetical protein PLUA15_310061 [Pseudomonas lundensis]